MKRLHSLLVDAGRIPHLLIDLLLPTQAEKAALRGFPTVPGPGNPYLTQDHARDQAAHHPPQPANTVLAGPVSGADDAPAFRALAVADIPAKDGAGAGEIPKLSTGGDLRFAGGLSVGSAANNPDDGMIWAAGDIRASHGLAVGSTVALDPPAGEIHTTSHARIGGGLRVGSLDAPAGDGQISAQVACSGWLPVVAYWHLPSSMTDNPAYPFMIAIPRAGYVTTWRQTWHVFTTNNADNYWTVALHRTNNDNQITSWTTAGGSPNTWTLQTIDINASVNASIMGVYIRAAKHGAPGALSLGAPAIFLQ